MLGSWPLGFPEDGRFYVEFARHAEQLGYDLLCSGDHLFMHSPNADPLTVLSTWAGVTERIVLGTAVLLVPLRDPALTAKQLATIDVVSCGRLAVGVGAGGEIQQEWDAMEVPRAGRGRRLDEYLDLMRALWSGRPVDVDGEFRSVHGVTGTPIPVQPGGPPIWVGGRSDAALDRAARHQGWCAYASSPDRVRRSVERIRSHPDHDPTTFRTSMVLFTIVDDDAARARERAVEVLGTRYQQDFKHFIDAFCAVGTPDHVRARVAEYRDAGVDDVLLCPQVPWSAYLDQATALAEALSIRHSTTAAGSQA